MAFLIVSLLKPISKFKTVAATKLMLTWLIVPVNKLAKLPGAAPGLMSFYNSIRFSLTHDLIKLETSGCTTPKVN